MLTFANPAFLFALAGLAVPVIVHLINRERAQPLKFPSIRYIELARLPQEGKRSLRDLLLLLLRMLFYACIILALAGPRWQPDNPPATVADTAALEPTIFVVDGSVSMSGWGSWERLQSEFSERLKTVDAVNPVGLVFYASEVIESIDPSLERSLVTDIVASEIPRRFRGRPALAINDALKKLVGAEKGRIILLSDFQSSDWQISRWPEIPEHVSLEMISVADFEKPNLGIVQAQAFPASEGRVRLVGRVKNFSNEPQEVTVTLSGQKELGQQLVSLAPDQTQPFNFVIEPPKDLAGSLTLPEDSYAADNQYAIWLGPPPPTRIVSVLPLLQEPERMAEVEFVGKSLEVTTRTAVQNFQLIGINTDSDLSTAGIHLPANPVTDEEQPLKPANESALAQAARPNVLYLPGSGGYLYDEQWQGIAHYVREGGTLLLTPGKSVAKTFRQLRQFEISSIGYFGQPGRDRDRRNPHRIGWLNENSDLGEVFDKDSIRDLFLTEIYQYVRLRPGEATEVLIKTENDDPLLLREKVGKGSVIVSAFSWDGRASDLPIRNSFLPIVRELLNEAAPAEGGVVRIECGDPIPPSFASYGLDPVTVAIDQYTSEPNVFKFSNLPVEVNVSRDESLPQSAVLSDIRANLFGTSHTLEEEEEAATDDFTTEPIQHSASFALLAFLFLFLETFIAGWLDNRFKTRHA